MAGPSCRLKKKWNQGPSALAILVILVAKSLDHEPFLCLRFEPEGEQAYDDPDKTAREAIEEGCTEHGGEQSGIYRVAHEGVWSALYEFVVLLDGDPSAPIAAKYSSGPKGYEYTSQCKHSSYENPCLVMRDETMGEPASLKKMADIKDQN